MKSNADTVDEYMLQAPENRVWALQKIRQLCLTYLPDHEENMAYSMPSYVRGNQVEIAFASQKQHICVYILIHEVMLSNSDRLVETNHGKGCIRFSNPNKIDFGLIEYLIKETAKSDTSIC